MTTKSPFRPSRARGIVSVPRPLDFNTFTDSTDFIPHFQGVGAWRLTYEVQSDNVPRARRSVRLRLDGTLDGVCFEPI
jgi:hypothetical protein